MVTEFGRQPWVIYGLLRTEDAVTTATALEVSFLIFSVIYVLLALTLVWLLRNLSRIPVLDQPKEGEQPKEQRLERAGV
jgi:cytochrome d ubiquinol oxidase subunit I